MQTHEPLSGQVKLPRDWTILQTMCVAAIMLVVFVTAATMITTAIEERSRGRLEEAAQSVIDQVRTKLNWESRLLNATADIFAEAESFDIDSIQDTVRSISPLLETMFIRVLLPDNRLVSSGGTVSKVGAEEGLDFSTAWRDREYVSDKSASLDGSIPVLRHFVPILRDGKPAALLYGVTYLRDLARRLNVDRIYNGTASVFIVNRNNGEFLMNSRNSKIKNVREMLAEETEKGTWTEMIGDMLSGEKGWNKVGNHQNGSARYIYYDSARVNHWSIVVSVPEREAFSTIYKVRTIFCVIAIILLAAVIISYILASGNARRRLAMAMEQARLSESLRKAQAADRAKSTFLSNMSHDIRTPMNAIIGFTNLVQSNLDNRERVQDYLKKIVSASTHLLSLINDILEMSRIESGKLNIEEKPCSVADIFRDMRNIILSQMQSKHLNFYMNTVDIRDEDIYCDKLHVNQVLLNLLSNAIKFTPSGGTVVLSISQKPCARKGFATYVISIRDSGIGMSEEFARHVFEPFERERNSTVSGIQGTGLGMAITKNIVDTMGGRIEVHTEQGKGTEFILTFDFRLQSASGELERIPELESQRALVVDDTFPVCDSISRMLRQMGMRPDWTLHGEEAVLRARQAHDMQDGYSLFIIDWQLPDLGGIEVIRQIRAVVGGGVPIILVTAYDWSIFEDEARRAGVTAFCSKPVFLSELRDTLASVAAGRSPSPQETPPLVSHTERERNSRCRLLLVEDNEFNMEIAEEILTEAGFLVETAEDGDVAVEKVRASKPGYYALILMDIQMSRMDGYEASRAIRALPDPALASVPIVAMTANAFEEDRKTALESGMNAHVSKPIDITKLLNVLSALLPEAVPARTAGLDPGLAETEAGQIGRDTHAS